MAELMSHRDGQLRLGSLFSGSGGFELAGCLHGIEPVFASEIEPFPIRVTKNRFPSMKHLGSVTDVRGDQVEPMDIITFGSPCQDLSVAGKQAGIHEGQRSNLFFEAIRIIKEMRNATSDQFPRFAVWENVPGAFSSNKGRDFQAVLQAFAEIGEKGTEVSVPFPEKGKWLPAGTVVGNGWSLAWRVYDAQFWGVPQRRKRIYLIADFGSERAGEILFKPEGVSGHPQKSGKDGEGTAEDAEGGPGRSDRAFNESGVGYWMSGFGCLRAEGENRPSRPNHVVVRDPVVVCTLASSCVNAEITDGSISPTLMARAGTGGNQLPLLCLNDQGGSMMDVSDKAGRLRAQEHGHQPVVCFEPGIAKRDGSEGRFVDGKSVTLRANAGDNQPAVCYGVDCRNGVIEEEKSHTIQAHNNGGFSVNCTPNVLFRNNGYGNFTEGSGTLKAHGGDAGGGRNASSLSIYSVENHSNDSRVTIRDDDKCQTLTSRMGTGGNNVPMILEIMDE